MKSKILSAIALSLALTACAPDDGALGPQGPVGSPGVPGVPGDSPELVAGTLTLTAFRDGPNYVDVLDQTYFVTVPQGINVVATHNSSGPGWITIVLANKTFCYQPATGGTANSKVYNLRVVRSGDDTSCVTGAQSNVSFSGVELAPAGSTVRMTIHTPQLANGTQVVVNLDAFRFE